MQIKTLAEMLADIPASERNDKTDKTNKQHKKDQQNQKRQRRALSLPKSTQALSKRSPKPAQSSHHSPNYLSHSISIEEDDNKDNNKNGNDETSNYDKAGRDDTIQNSLTDADHKACASNRTKASKKAKDFHPASPYQPTVTPTVTPSDTYTPPDAHTIKSILAQIHQQPTTSNELSKPHHTHEASPPALAELPVALHAYLKTPEQRAAEKEQIKAESRLRWLAFYYLSRREHSAAELKQKLLDKDQDPKKIDALLQEFAEKGYQSEMRTAIMLIREGIRKRRGRGRIKQEFYQRQVDVPANIDELIDMANADSEAFTDVMATDDLIEGVDWLKLAVEARVKKYGDDIPSTPKDKARQLRFLQYRGFQADVCFDALKYNLETLIERF